MPQRFNCRLGACDSGRVRNERKISEWVWLASHKTDKLPIKYGGGHANDVAEREINVPGNETADAMADCGNRGIWLYLSQEIAPE